MDNTDLVTQWAIQYQVWVNENIALIEAVYALFLQNEEWPSVLELQREIFKGGDSETDVQVILKSRPLVPGRAMPLMWDNFTLTTRDLANVEVAKPLVELITLAVQMAVAAYKSVEKPPVVRKILFESFPTPGREYLLSRLPKFLFTENSSPFAGGSTGDDWSVNVNENTVRYFDGVSNVQQYLIAQETLIRSFTPHKVENGSTSILRIYQVFVMMPFGPAWSVEVYQSITECAHMVDPTMIVVRADKLNTPGRITLQVEKEIGVADFVIADVTDNNPNVLWELGFAHALERPSVILSQDIGQAPFDFRDFRMIKYTNPLDPNARQQLMAHIRNSIEIVESNSKMGKTPGELWRG
jgi:hypothetical protein